MWRGKFSLDIAHLTSIVWLKQNNNLNLNILHVNVSKRGRRKEKSLRDGKFLQSLTFLLVVGNQKNVLWRKNKRQPVDVDRESFVVRSTSKNFTCNVVMGEENQYFLVLWCEWLIHDETEILSRENEERGTSFSAIIFIFIFMNTFEHIFMEFRSFIALTLE